MNSSVAQILIWVQYFLSSCLILGMLARAPKFTSEPGSWPTLRWRFHMLPSIFLITHCTLTCARNKSLGLNDSLLLNVFQLCFDQGALHVVEKRQYMYLCSLSPWLSWIKQQTWREGKRMRWNGQWVELARVEGTYPSASMEVRQWFKQLEQCRNKKT